MEKENNIIGTFVIYALTLTLLEIKLRRIMHIYGKL